MAYASRTDIGTGRATGGVIGIYASLGLGLALMAFAAAFAIRGTTTDDPSSVAAGISSVLVGLLPIIAIPILAIVTGVWAGTSTRSGGQGAAAGAIGTLVGIFVLLILVGIGYALGIAAAQVDLSQVDTGGVSVPTGLQDQLGYLGTVAGLTYLVSNVLASALAGAVTGGVMPKYEPRPAVGEERARGPARI